MLDGGACKSDVSAGTRELDGLKRGGGGGGGRGRFIKKTI